MSVGLSQRAAFHAVLLWSVVSCITVLGESSEQSRSQEARTSDFNEKIVRIFVDDVDAGRQDACLARFASDGSARRVFLDTCEQAGLLKGNGWRSELSSMSTVTTSQDRASARFRWHRAGMVENPENHGRMEVTVQEFSCQLEAVRRDNEWRFTAIQVKSETDAYEKRVAASIEEDLKRADRAGLSDMEKASVYYGAAYKYISIRRFESAETAARKSVGCLKTFHGCYTLGYAMKAQGKFDQAREQFSQALTCVDGKGVFARTAEQMIRECSEQAKK